MPTPRPAAAADLPAVFDAWARDAAASPAGLLPPRPWLAAGLARALDDPSRFRLFVLERGGRVVGTASVQRDRGFADDRVAWLGHLSAPSPPGLDALLDAVRGVARGWGAAALRGPRGLSRFEFVGVTVAGFATRPPMLQADHPPALGGWLEAAGLSPHHDHLAYETALVEADGAPRPLPRPLAEKAAACSLPGLRFERARRHRLDADLLAAHGVLNEAYATVPDVRPMPRAQFLGICRALLLTGHPELIQVGWLADRAVAFAVCLPELNEAFAAAPAGRLWPLGWARVLRAWPRIQTAAFKLVGVVPDLRGTGLHAALIAEVVRGAQRAGFRRMDGSIIDARNAPMRGVVEGAGMTVYRRYRVYTQPL